MDVEYDTVQVDKQIKSIKQLSLSLLKEFQSIQQTSTQKTIDNQKTKGAKKNTLNQTETKIASYLKSLSLSLELLPQQEELIQQECPQLVELHESYDQNIEQNKEINCLLAVNFLQILRVSAPASPFDDDRLQVLFELVYDSLDCLSNSQYSSIGLELLNLLSTTKCHILLLDIDEDKYAFKTIQVVFQNLSQISQSNEQRHEILQYAQQIVNDTLEQIKEANSKLFELLLSYTLNPKTTSNKLFQSFSLACNTLTHFEKEFRPIVLSQTAACFEGQAKQGHIQINSNYFKSIFMYMPETMSQIIPYFEGQIHELIEQRRFWAINQIAKILITVSQLYNSNKQSISSKLNDVVSSKLIEQNFQLLFDLLIGRIKDISAEIRQLVIEDSLLIVKENNFQQASKQEKATQDKIIKINDGRFQAQLQPKIDDMLQEICERLRDANEKIRICALSVLSSFIILFPKHLKQEYVREIQQRLQDQKFGVRKESAIRQFSILSYFFECFIHTKVAQICPSSLDRKFQVKSEQYSKYVEKQLKISWEDIIEMTSIEQETIKLIYSIPGNLLASQSYDQKLFKYIIEDVIASKGLFNQTFFQPDQGNTYEAFITPSQVQPDADDNQDELGLSQDSEEKEEEKKGVKEQGKGAQGKKNQKIQASKQPAQQMQLGQFPNSKQKIWIQQMQYFVQSYLIFQIIVAMDKRSFSFLINSVKRHGLIIGKLQRLVEIIQQLDALQPSKSIAKMIKGEKNEGKDQLTDSQKLKLSQLQNELKNVITSLAAIVGNDLDAGSSKAPSSTLTYILNRFLDIRDIAMMQILSQIAEGRDVVTAQNLVSDFVKSCEKNSTNQTSNGSAQTLVKGLRAILNSAQLSLIGQFQFNGLVMVFNIVSQALQQDPDSQTNNIGSDNEIETSQPAKARGRGLQGARTMISDIAQKTANVDSSFLFNVTQDMQFMDQVRLILQEDKLYKYFKQNLHAVNAFQIMNIAQQSPTICRLPAEFVGSILEDNHQVMIILVLKILQGSIQTGIRSPPFQRKLLKTARKQQNIDVENYPKSKQAPFTKAAQLNSLDWQSNLNLSGIKEMTKHKNYRIARNAAQTLGLIYFCFQSRVQFDPSNEEYSTTFNKLEKLLRSTYNDTENQLQKPILGDNFLEITSGIHVMSYLGQIMPQIYSDYSRAFGVFLEDNYMYSQAGISREEFDQLIDQKSLDSCKDNQHNRYHQQIWNALDPCFVAKTTCYKAIARSCVPMNVQSRFQVVQKQQEYESSTSLCKSLFENFSSILLQEVVYEDTDKIEHLQQGLTRLMVAEAMLILIQKYDKYLTPKQYTCLALTIQDPIYEVRGTFQQKIWKYVKKMQLSPKLAALFSLSGMDPQIPHRENSIEFIKQFIYQRRATVQKIIDNQNKIKQEDVKALKNQVEATDKSKGLFLHNLPEFSLYYVIYILAHHPDFQGPDMDQDFKPFQIMLQYALLPYLILDDPHQQDSKKQQDLTSQASDINLFDLDFINYVISTILNSIPQLKDSQQAVKNGDDQTDSIQFLALLAKKEWNQLVTLVAEKQGKQVNKKAKYDVQLSIPKEYKQDTKDKPSTKPHLAKYYGYLQNLQTFELSQNLLSQVKERVQADATVSHRGKAKSSEQQKENVKKEIVKQSLRDTQSRDHSKRKKKERKDEKQPKKKSRSREEGVAQTTRPLRNSNQRVSYKEAESDTDGISDSESDSSTQEDIVRLSQQLKTKSQQLQSQDPIERISKEKSPPDSPIESSNQETQDKNQNDNKNGIEKETNEFDLAMSDSQQEDGEDDIKKPKKSLRGPRKNGEAAQIKVEGHKKKGAGRPKVDKAKNKKQRRN